MPEELRRREQWVVFKYMKRLGGKKATKVPYVAGTGTKASTTDSDTWRTFGEAVQGFEDGGYDGLGFVFSSGDPFAGVDLDDCRDPKTGQLQDWAQVIVDDLDGYTEVSPSGTGVHVIVRGKAPNKKRDKVEAYSLARFFTMTGDALRGAGARIPDRTGELDGLTRKNLNGPEGRDVGRNGRGQPPAGVELLDEEIIEGLRQADNSAKFSALYDTMDTSAYEYDESRADLALLGILKFWTQDPVQLERLFGRSVRGKRDKWRARPDYQQRTIEKALSSPGETYTRALVGGGKNTPDDQEAPPKRASGKGDDEAPTHDELRDRWVAENLDHAFGLGTWRRYWGGIWPVVKTPLVKQGMVRVLEAAKGEKIRPSVWLLNSIHDLAQFDRYVDDERWDGNQNILVAENGAVNIANQELEPHSLGHYATTRVPYAFDPKAVSPNWTRFMNSVDPGVGAFLQEFAGYCLTTDTSYETAVWLIGQPGGGKSTLLEGLAAMLGARAGTLGLAEIERSRFSLAKLEGKTLVTAAEQPGGFVSCHHIINAIISGEPVQVERKFKDPYDLVPRAKIAWAMNELPRIPSGAEGLFRRVQVVEFPAIAEEDRDPTVKEGIKGEGAGILNWALEGLRRLRGRGGFKVAGKIKDATTEFKEHNDPVKQFVEEQCETGAGCEIRSSELYKKYKWWCEETSHRPRNSTNIVEDWKRLGFRKKERKDGNYWLGVTMKVQP